MPTSDWLPSVGAVGALLRARTRDSQGNEVGTFTADTRPTEEQVLGLITSAAGDLSSAAGADLPEAVWHSAFTAAAYKTAMLVELSYFPEQVANGRSPYEQMESLHKEALKNLKAAVEYSGGDVPGGAPGVPEAPIYSFPGASSLDALLGASPGGYDVPNSGGRYYQ
jgi:hypothetical protein